MLDQLSPVAPARIKLLLLPLGRIKRVKFLEFAARLRAEHVVQLGDISPDGRPNRNLFSPLAFPRGRIVFDMVLHGPPESQDHLYPFELYREPMVVVTIADGTELEHAVLGGKRQAQINGSRVSVAESTLRKLHQELEEVRDQYPRALVHQTFLFDHSKTKGGAVLPEGVISIPPLADCRTTTLKTIMCDTSSLLLAEIAILAKSFQSANGIDFPNADPRSASAVPWSPRNRSARRSSHAPSPRSRTNSPVERNHARMSMPASRLESNVVLPVGSPGSPASTLPTMLEQVERPISADTKYAGKPPALSRSSTMDSARDGSRDRVPSQNASAQSMSDRARNKGRARKGIVVGTLYMCAGRWNDGMKELAENGTMAKVNLDHIWHAKALDCILVCMLMLAWTGADFNIPQICHASAEKAAMSARTSANRLVVLQELVAILPELVDRMLGLYNRAANNTGEGLPELSQSESIIRWSKLLAAINSCKGTITEEVLQKITLGVSSSSSYNSHVPRPHHRPTRTDIVTLLYKAFPQSSTADAMPAVDRIHILSAIASVLDSLGFQRKKAFILRELISTMIPGLIQARIRGAADMGVHPAAGLTALGHLDQKGVGMLDADHGTSPSNGVEALLAILSRTYGIASSDTQRIDRSDNADVFSDDSAIQRILEHASVRAFGSQSMKLDILRLCINLSEALPDFQGVLTYTIDLLRTVGSGTAPGPNNDASPTISQEEQVRLATNISKAIGAARDAGIDDLAGHYWDEFLVRGVSLEPLPPTRTPLPHDWKDMTGAAASTPSHKGPFIHNPFLRTTDQGPASQILVVGETSNFRVVLQNPYELELDVESLQLEADSSMFASAVQRTIIGPYRTQILSISGTPLSPGSLRITGCIARIRGCKERRFPVFEKPWAPRLAAKVKSIGLNANSGLHRQGSIRSTPDPDVALSPPSITTLELQVIPQQPIIIVKSTTLSQSALMLLEGERQRFSVTLQNLSPKTPADFIQFSFKDSNQASLHAALSNKDMSAAEHYECELALATKPALRWIRADAQSERVAANSAATFDIEVLGTPGLTEAVVVVDYAYLGKATPDTTAKSHTRQISMAIAITVNASIEVVRTDAMPLLDSTDDSLWSSVNFAKLQPMAPASHCLVQFDVRNTWPSHLRICLNVDQVGTIEEDLLPGNSTRILVPMLRVFLESPHAPIPVLVPSRARQFVVSASQISAAAERVNREAFWYREGFLKQIQGNWRTLSGPERSGDIAFRSIRLAQRSIDALAIEDVGLDLRIVDSHLPQSSSITVDNFSSLSVLVTNRTKSPLLLLLRLQPSVRHKQQHGSNDLSKKLVWNGVLQRPLPLLAANKTTEVVLGLTALCEGEFEVGASVEEVVAPDQARGQAAGANGSKRASAFDVLDTALGGRPRRVWHARQPCVISVVDA